MLSPKRMKFRKKQKGRIRGLALRGGHLAFGEYALQATEAGRVTAVQIEAARVAMTRAVKRGGQVWIKIFPDHPVSKKPAEVRQGKGKGAVDHYVAMVKKGRVLYEMAGVSAAEAKEALQLAASKLAIKTKLLFKSEDPWA